MIAKSLDAYQCTHKTGGKGKEKHSNISMGKKKKSTVTGRIQGSGKRKSNKNRRNPR